MRADLEAISGAPMPNPDAMNPQPPGTQVFNNVGARPGDAFFASLMGSNEPNFWQCAALKILSNASGHKLYGLSEKWVGCEQDPC
jgi:hypothetical protein